MDHCLLQVMTGILFPCQPTGLSLHYKSLFRAENAYLATFCLSRAIQSTLKSIDRPLRESMIASESILSNLFPGQGFPIGRGS